MGSERRRGDHVRSVETGPDDRLQRYTESMAGARRACRYGIVQRAGTASWSSGSMLRMRSLIGRERDKALAAVRATAPGPRRVFVGKYGDRATLVSLADAQGKPRLVLTVDPGRQSANRVFGRVRESRHAGAGE